MCKIDNSLIDFYIYNQVYSILHGLVTTDPGYRLSMVVLAAYHTFLSSSDHIVMRVGDGILNKV